MMWIIFQAFNQRFFTNNMISIFLFAKSYCNKHARERMNQYSGKHIWITGASSGIGEALACELAREKARLVLSGRNEEKLRDVKSRCSKEGAIVSIYLFDLGNEQIIPEVVKNVIDELGHIDLLINNGGISQRSLVTETGTDIDHKIMDINFFGNISLTKALLPYMLESGGGHLAVTTSIVGKFGFPLRSAYSASKHALYGFYESLNLEMRNRPITISMICPGRIKTAISHNALNPQGEKHGILDEGQANGITAEKSARKIIRGLKKGKREILVGGQETIMVYIRKLFPGIFYYIAGKIKHT